MSTPLTKDQMLTALKEGKTVTHAYFSDDEWMRLNEFGYYEFEDGVTCRGEEFWKFRDCKSFLTDWFIVEGDA